MEKVIAILDELEMPGPLRKTVAVVIKSLENLVC